MRAVEHKVWRVVLDGTRGSNVQKIGGGVERFDPKFWWHVGLDKESADNVVDGANGTLSLAVLW